MVSNPDFEHWHELRRRNKIEESRLAHQGISDEATAWRIGGLSSLMDAAGAGGF